MFTEIAPPASIVAVLYNPQTAPYGGRMVRTMEDAAKSIGVVVRDTPCHDDNDIEAAAAALAERGGGLLALGDIFTQVHRDTIIGTGLKYKLPVIANTRQVAEAGALVSYVLDIPNLFGRSATYVDRILNGEKPADLPVQAPTKFELLINLKTAKTLGVAIPNTLLAIADEVIE